MLENGAEAIIASRDTGKAKAALTHLGDAVKARFIQADLADRASIESLVDQAECEPRTLACACPKTWLMPLTCCFITGGYAGHNPALAPPADRPAVDHHTYTRRACS